MRVRTLVFATLATSCAIASANEVSDPLAAAREADRTRLLLYDNRRKPAPAPQPEAARERMLQLMREDARTTYERLLRSLSLEPAAAEECLEILAQNRVRTTGWATDSYYHEPTETDHAAARKATARLEALLGSVGVDRLRSYEETLFERYQMRRLVQLLTRSGEPLSDEQHEQLVAVMAAERHRRDVSRLTPPQDTLEWAEAFTELVDEFDAYSERAFADALSPEQVKLAAEHFRQRRARRHTALERYRRGLAEGSNFGFVYPPD